MDSVEWAIGCVKDSHTNGHADIQQKFHFHRLRKRNIQDQY